MNVHYTNNNINSFIESLKGFESLPSRETLEKKLSNITTPQDLKLFIKEHNL